jgi:NAD-dependent SIR2 family protein deacetylase
MVMDPDYRLPRTPEEFWVKNMDFKEDLLLRRDVETPEYLAEDPRRFWGHWGHKIVVARYCEPNSTYQNILRILKKYSFEDYFIVTQNTHGFLQRLDVPEERIWEMFGNINFFQSAGGKILSNQSTHAPSHLRMKVPHQGSAMSRRHASEA